MHIFTLLKRSARKFCIFSILNHRKLICFRSSYDIFCFLYSLCFPDILLKRSARKFCIFSILNHRKLIWFRLNYDIFVFNKISSRSVEKIYEIWLEHIFTLPKRSAIKFCIFSILNHRKLIWFRSSYDIFCFCIVYVFQIYY